MVQTLTDTPAGNLKLRHNAMEGAARLDPHHSCSRLALRLRLFRSGLGIDDVREVTVAATREEIEALEQYQIDQ